MSSRTRSLTLTGALVVLVGVAVLASITIGSRPVAVGDVFAVLTGNGGDLADRGVVEARIARTAVGLLVGAGLAVAGAAMQGLTRNPLADPGLLGVNAGASLAVVVAISVFGVGTLTGYVWWAMAGAGLAAVLVHALAGLARGGVTPLRLTLAGAAVSAGLASWSSGLLVSSQQSLDSFRFWQVGTIGGRGLDLVITVLPFFAFGLVVVLLAVRQLNALALGDDLARGLGENLLFARSAVAVGVAVLCGAATALAGPVGFLGLVVPHVARFVVGPDHRRIIPVCLLIGPALLLVADVVGRVVARPTEVQAGIMTAAVGVPVFVVLVRRGRMATL
ncbi:iron ABC transporter permease [Humibacillus sp. DSM 29435]|uniref:FecCD family ABC transporter permease n=1 Tax=Humibacillus sp. DSM 29435 TaxID=1869167 RepID=UPI0008723AEF|nr:iron ABC transporter permease [Humibacillus sp. DSM 29435]OFE16053.1 iron ABC transporter permease [Humibacillus sp. DSM 29435]